MREDFKEDILNAIRPNPEDLILRRIKNGNFAKTIIWLCACCKDSDYIGVGELARFMRFSLQRSRYVLEDFVKMDLLRRNKISGCAVDYYFAFEKNGDIRVLKYFNQAKKSLGIKFKMEVKKENRKV